MISPQLRLFSVFGPCLLLVVARSPLLAEGPANDEHTAREALIESLLGEDPLSGDTSGSSPTSQLSDEAPTKELDPTDGKTATPAGNPPAGEDQQLTDFERTTLQLRQKLKQAETAFAAGTVGPKAQAAQTDAIAATARLIELLKQRATSSAQSRSGDASGHSTSQAGGNQQPSADQNSSSPRPGTAPSQANISGPARPNEEGASSARKALRRDPAAVYSAFRQRVIEHSWGHLPGQIRQRLRNGGADKSLPRYESLVNRYFQSLVRPESQPTEDQPSP